MNILSVDKSEIAENAKANLIVYKTLLQGGILKKLVAVAKNVRDLQKQLAKEGKEKDLLELLEGECKASAVLVELAEMLDKDLLPGEYANLEKDPVQLLLTDNKQLHEDLSAVLQTIEVSLDEVAETQAMREALKRAEAVADLTIRNLRYKFPEKELPTLEKVREMHQELLDAIKTYEEAKAA